MNEKTTAIFTITEAGGAYNIKCKRYSEYNKYNVPKGALWLAMSDLADVFNNVLEIGILFAIE